MVDNYWEQVVFKNPPLVGLEPIDESTVFHWLGLHFPVLGSKIDWARARARESHIHWNFSDNSELTAAAAREVAKRAKDDSVVEHAGDSLSPYGVRFRGADALSVVTALLQIPEHHYFLAIDRSWVVVVSLEGDLDVAERLM